ncbi:MAG: hypothetical protein KHX03_07820 [Clostridium sp.]|nr:hypothetical protein [Clostridium sp.]
MLYDEDVSIITLNFLEKMKKKHEKELVINTYNIIKNYTNYVEKEIELYKRDKNGLSAIDRVLNREQYAIDNYKSILKILNVTSEIVPDIISIYVTKIRTY